MSAGGPATSPGFLLWHTTLRWQRDIAAALKPLGLTHVQFVLLASVWWLADRGSAPPTQVQLAEHAGTDPMMTSQVVRALVGRGLIERERDPSDGRAWRLVPTPGGVDLAQRAVVVVEAQDDEFFAALDRDELVSTLAALASTE